MKKKQIATKIILGIIVSGFVLSFSQFTFPLQVSAVSNNTGLDWENPNKSGDNPYKVTTDAILNSQTLMNVVGCTGLVDKVSGAITSFLKDQVTNLLKSKATVLKEQTLAKACAVGKGILVMPPAAIPNVTISQAIADGYQCPNIQKTSNTSLDSKQDETNRILAATKKREECFNGLAYTLAKNQLTSMTRQTVNWVNTGFNGNPMYVQNMTSLTNSIERNVIETGVAVVANGAFPYGGDFNKTLIRSYNSGAMNGAAKFLNNLTSDLSSFITSKDSYFNTKDSSAALRRAQEDNNRFANDFSVGGWDGYMALTQRDQNNPLGFTMQASQYVADRINQQATETKNEVLQNNGFLSQKECTKWQLFNNKGVALTNTDSSTYAQDGNSLSKDVGVYSASKSGTTPNFDKCVDWKVTTPGSIIKDKLTTYINSPERQLELADTMNKSLSSLFTKLIENFRSEGLLGLSQEKYSAIDNMGGYGVNGTSTGDNIASGYSTASYGSSAGYSNDSFDLTRDLGNTYIHDAVTKIGSWNAKTNTPQLNVELGPYNEIAQGYYSPNYYYTVSVAGNTKLFNNGYTGWAVGDRAFWNGKEWQNWKKGQTSPVKIRGIIQTQTDYVVAAREILKLLPSIMPKIGELDYCIPGPNPNFANNSMDTGTAFGEYSGTLVGTYDDGSFFVRNSTTYNISKPSDRGDTKYDIYAAIFKDIPEVFKSVQRTYPWTHLLSFDGTQWKKNSDEARMQGEVDTFLLQIQTDIKKFNEKYKTEIFDGVYGKMRSEFNEKENTSDVTKNSAYVPMIEDGYAITKDMVSRNDDLNTEIQDYRDAIIQAESNTGKLNTIKGQVSAIIKAAQDRRDILLLADLNKQNATSGTSITMAKYKEQYAACFDEEDILYYDYNKIITDNSVEAERCNDNIDNDLDGLIDSKDPDCKPKQ